MLEDVFSISSFLRQVWFAIALVELHTNYLISIYIGDGFHHDYPFLYRGCLENKHTVNFWSAGICHSTFFSSWIFQKPSSRLEQSQWSQKKGVSLAGRRPCSTFWETMLSGRKSVQQSPISTPILKPKENKTKSGHQIQPGNLRLWQAPPTGLRFDFKHRWYTP